MKILPINLTYNNQNANNGVTKNKNISFSALNPSKILDDEAKLFDRLLKKAISIGIIPKNSQERVFGKIVDTLRRSIKDYNNNELGNLHFSASNSPFPPLVLVNNKYWDCSRPQMQRPKLCEKSLIRIWKNGGNIMYKFDKAQQQASLTFSSKETGEIIKVIRNARNGNPVFEIVFNKIVIAPNGK